MVGETGFEPVLSSSRTTRAARLRYSPIVQKPLLRVPLRARSSGGKETHLDTPGYVISRRATKAIDGMATLCSGRCPSSPVDCHSRLHVRYNTENSSRKDGRGGRIQTVDHALPKRGCYQATPHPDDYCRYKKPLRRICLCG